MPKCNYPDNAIFRSIQFSNSDKYPTGDKITGLCFLVENYQ